MSRLVCFIDEDGRIGTCLNFVREGDCENCEMRRKLENDDSLEFTAWSGKIKNLEEDK